MKPLHFDAINPFTGTPFTFDDPNLKFVNGNGVYLEPGDDGFVPYPGMIMPKPETKKKRPFHRSPKQPDNSTSTPPTTLPTMSTFKYNIAPKSTGGFTTRVVRTEPVADATLLGLIASEASLTPQQAEAVLRAFAKVALGCSSGCAWSSNFLGIYSFRPTSGGSNPAPDGFHNPADINADVSLSFSPETISTWQHQLTLESQGEVGKVTPAIDTIICQSGGGQDKYIAGGLIQVRGDYLNFKTTDLTQGIFFKPATGPEVRAGSYAVIKPQSVVVLVPTGLTGPLIVRVSSFINGSVRSDTYTNPITPGP